MFFAHMVRYNITVRGCTEGVHRYPSIQLVLEVNFKQYIDIVQHTKLMFYTSLILLLTHNDIS